jgi:hypothetical protein
MWYELQIWSEDTKSWHQLIASENLDYVDEAFNSLLVEPTHRLPPVQRYRVVKVIHDELYTSDDIAKGKS